MQYNLETITYSNIEPTPTEQKIAKSIDTFLNYTKTELKPLYKIIRDVMTTDITDIFQTAKDFIYFTKEKPYVPGSTTPKRKKGNKNKKKEPHVNKYSPKGPRRWPIPTDYTPEEDQDKKRVESILKSIRKNKKRN